VAESTGGVRTAIDRLEDPFLRSGHSGNCATPTRLRADCSPQTRLLSLELSSGTSSMRPFEASSTNGSSRRRRLTQSSNSRPSPRERDSTRGCRPSRRGRCYRDCTRTFGCRIRCRSGAVRPPRVGRRRARGRTRRSRGIDDSVLPTRHCSNWPAGRRSSAARSIPFSTTTSRRRFASAHSHRSSGWMDPLSGSLIAGAARRPVDVFVAPLSGDDRTLCVVRDRRRSPAATLSTIHRMITAMRAAESRSGVFQSAVDATVASSDADLAGWYLIEADVLRPAAVATRAETDRAEPPPIERADIDLLEHLETEADADGEGVVFDRPDIEPALSRPESVPNGCLPFRSPITGSSLRRVPTRWLSRHTSRRRSKSSAGRLRLRSMRSNARRRSSATAATSSDSSPPLPAVSNCRRSNKRCSPVIPERNSNRISVRLVSFEFDDTLGDDRSGLGRRRRYWLRADHAECMGRPER